MASVGTPADRAFAALAAGDPAAPALFEAAIGSEPGNRTLLIGQAEALLVAGATEPDAQLAAAIRKAPDWVEGQAALAGLRWELGHGPDYASELVRAIKQNPANAALWNAHIQAAAGAGEYAAAADIAARAARIFDVPALKLIEANHAGMIGDDARVARLLEQVPGDSPDRQSVSIRHFIRTGDLRQANATLERMLARPEADLGTWALAELLWRKCSDARWQWLAAQPGLIATMKLSMPTTQLHSLAETLRRLHRQRAQPLGQSVRGGTQTRGSLLQRTDPELRAMRTAFEAAIQRYRDQLPAEDGRHPLLRHRGRKLKISGSWSVRLTDAGYHVAHLHPAGVLSSAFYVQVPAADGPERSGWLELGRPPADLRLELEPLAMVQPEAGTLVLFPSFLYHGTRPFGTGERLSIAFDVD